MRLKLEQKQMLKMVMTTELRQAIELLQLSTYELFQFIQQQAEENPFIEFVENDDRTYQKKSHYNVQQTDSLDVTIKNEKGMHEQLLEQIMMFPLTDEEYSILHYMILNINERGFLTITDSDIANSLDKTEQEVRRLRGYIHKLEPLGIGSSDLAECLLLQSMEAFPCDEILSEIIRNYLQELADKQWQRIEKQLHISLERVQESYEKIQTLNPRPATGFTTSNIDYVTPDLSIELDEQRRQYMVHLHDHYIPAIEFNQSYSDMLPESKDVTRYVHDHFKRFQWLQKSIVQRRQTIMKIMDVIIRHQKDFLQYGLRALKPLTLNDIAEEINMHESTVSRATSNKIVQTPVGTFELKSLFSTRLKTTSGNGTSQTTVKEMIRDVIEQENKYKPLSDQMIVHQLKNKDIIISRRTIAKYREELQIPASSKRRDIKL